ncbi:MAG: PilZ domain-containing protein [Deltaproteobacteria bacterium]|nr:PilZ domain-containing protein [Deltaproteobacteria bacterium]
MTGKPNQRRNVRVLCNLPAEALGPRGPIRGTCRNLSQGGQFLVGGPFTVGRSVEFTVQLPNGPLRALCEVRYPHAYPEGAGVGGRFERMDREDFTRLLDFLGVPESSVT